LKIQLNVKSKHNTREKAPHLYTYNYESTQLKNTGGGGRTSSFKTTSFVSSTLKPGPEGVAIVAIVLSAAVGGSGSST